MLQNLDVEVLYEAPLAMEEEHLAEVACECLNLDRPKPDLDEWRAMIDAWKHPEREVTVALVGKYTPVSYTHLHDLTSLPSKKGNGEVSLPFLSDSTRIHRTS